MIQVNVVYHQEDDGWWAESPTIPGFSAAGATLTDVWEQVRTGVPFALELPADEIDIRQEVDGQDVPFAISLTGLPDQRYSSVNSAPRVSVSASVGTVRVDLPLSA